MSIDFSEIQLAHALRTVQAGGYATACPALSAEEKALVYHYTYRGSDQIKVPVREKDGFNDEPLGMGLAAALEKLPPYSGQVYSAERWPEAERSSLRLRAALGQTPFQLNEKRWPTFLSATESRRVAEEHLDSYGGSGNKNCLLTIFSRTGRYIDALSHYGKHGSDPPAAEREVLFLPNTRFRIESVREATTCVEIELFEL